MTPLVSILSLVCIVLLAVFVYELFQLNVMEEELKRTKSDIKMWEDFAPMLQSGSLPEIKKSIQQDTNITV